MLSGGGFLPFAFSGHIEIGKDTKIWGCLDTILGVLGLINSIGVLNTLSPPQIGLSSPELFQAQFVFFRGRNDPTKPEKVTGSTNSIGSINRSEIFRIHKSLKKH